MKLENISRRGFLIASSALISLPFISCGGGDDDTITGPDSSSEDNPPSQKYTTITGTWDFSTQSNFSNSNFTGSLSANLNLTQTKENLNPSTYKVDGTFSNFGFACQKKSNGMFYLLAQGGSGNIVNGGINPNDGPYRVAFYLGSEKFYVRGVTSDYKSMSGDITAKAYLSPSEGNVTMTGTWKATRK